jgi:hypothetical protein
MKRHPLIALLSIGIIACAYISDEEWANRSDVDGDGLTGFADCAPQCWGACPEFMEDFPDSPL